MLKQLIAIIVLSVAIILNMSYAQEALNAILSAHHWISDLLTQIFSGGDAGNFLRKLLALLVIPVGVALIPIAIYWLAKKQWFPYFIEVVWAIWLVQTAALLILYKAA